LPGDNGAALLQTRTYPGVVPAPAAGDMAYLYRVDLTSVTVAAGGAPNCVTGMRINFPGGVVPLPYPTTPPHGPSDVFVVTSGGPGTVGLKAAVQNGVKIDFTFTAPVCPGAMSHFFGLASKSSKPLGDIAEVFFTIGDAGTPDRIPAP
jgi:hypothetical protein